MVTFNAAAMEQWNLGAHADSAALMTSINALMRPGGLTNPGAAMQYVVDNVLGSPGDRCAGWLRVLLAQRMHRILSLSTVVACTRHGGVLLVTVVLFCFGTTCTAACQEYVT